MKRLVMLLCILLLFVSLLPITTILGAVYTGKVRQYNERKPFVLKDNKTGWIFYLESNRRHITAIDNGGNIVWHKDPFKEAKLEPYRFEHPVIRWMGFPANDDTSIGITYDSSQSGNIKKINGEFIFKGQD